MRGRRHSPEQVVRKLREADKLLAEGAEVADVCRHLARIFHDAAWVVFRWLVAVMFGGVAGVVVLMAAVMVSGRAAGVALRGLGQADAGCRVGVDGG
jgi:hypothetical protein